MGPSQARTEREAPPSQPSPRPKNFVLRYDFYTPLITPRTHILIEIEREDYLRRPQSMKIRVVFHNRRYYCWFHHDYDHDTERCIELKNKIEDLIRLGYLEKYETDLRNCRVTQLQPHPDEEVHTQPTTGVINKISAGPRPLKSMT